MTARQEIPVQALGRDPAAGRHVALVPGTEVPLLALDLPARLRGPAREDVARRQLRDRIGLAGDGVEMRPFFAPGGDASWRRVLVADAARLAEWRALAGPGCRAVLPDYLALPAAEGLWSIRIEDGLVRARLGLEDGFSADPDLARLMLAQALDSAAAPPRAVLLSGGDDAIAALLEARAIAVARDIPQLAALGLAAPETLAHGELAFDLRADPGAARNRLRRRVLPWRWPLLIGLLAAGIWAAAQMVATRAIEREVLREREATLALVRRHFVPTGPVLDVRRQVSRVLAEQNAAARDWQGRLSPLSLFARVAPLVQASAAVSEEYGFDGTDLRAVLRLADFAAAETLVAALDGAGLRVEVVDLRVRDGESGVRAELRLGAQP